MKKLNWLICGILMFYNCVACSSNEDNTELSECMRISREDFVVANPGIEISAAEEKRMEERCQNLKNSIIE